MKTIDLIGFNERIYETGVALGNFDGIHMGHQFLIKDSIKKAHERGLKSSILLFKNHTRQTLFKQDKIKLKSLTSYEQKLKILDKLGVDLVYTIKFDEKLMRLTPEKFVGKILVDKLNSKLVTVGFDYRFGYGAAGDSKYLERLGKKFGFELNIIKPVELNGEIISSTNIRRLIYDGKIEKANKFLGRNYSIIGKVVKGNNRGRKLGFPTANLKLKIDYIIPKNGVYKTITNLNGERYKSITNIGYNPTFNGEELKIENHILDFNCNIYGKDLIVEFEEFVRRDINFNSPEELIEQIKKDIKYIKNAVNIYKL